MQDCSCQPFTRQSAHPRAPTNRAPSRRLETQLLCCLAALISFTSCAWAVKPGAPSEWAVPPHLNGSELYTKLLRSGAVSNSNISVYTDEPLLQALGRGPGVPLPFINIEAMLAQVIWQQHPQQAIDTAFMQFTTHATNTNTSSSSSSDSTQKQPEGYHAGQVPPSIHSAHPSLQHAIQFLLESPQAINNSFAHINDLANRKVWLAIAQIKAMARGHGACVPPGADMATAATDSPTDTAETDDEAAADAASTATTQPASYTCTLSQELQLLRWLVALLPRRFGLPLLRRMSVAALLQRRAGQQEPFTNPEQRQIVLLFLQLYTSHRTASMRKAVVEFFHISKAGGTSMCSLSQKNGCTTWDAGEKRNCLVYEFDDLPHWVSRKAHTQLQPNRTSGAWFINWEAERNQVFCSRRRHFMLMKGWDMYAHEYTLVGGRMSPRGVQLCTDMVTMLQVRHPYTRLVSHLRWIYGLYHEREADITVHWPNTTSAHWQYMAPPVVDNYYTRSLLGEGAYHLPSGHVRASHGVLAQLLVAQFDVLLVLEQSSSRRLGLGMGLGWTHIEQEEKQRSADDLMARVQAKKLDETQATNAAINEAIAAAAGAADTAAATTTDAADATATTVEPAEAAAATAADTAEPDAAGTASSASSATARKLLMDEPHQTSPVLGQASADVARRQLISGQAAGVHVRTNTGSSSDKAHSLIKAATSQGVPKDLGVLLEMNQVDLHLYQFASWLARFDAAVLETVKVALTDDAYAGLNVQGNKVKAQARMEARQRKVSADIHQAKEAAMKRMKSQKLWPPLPPAPMPAVPVDDPSTCGFAGY